MTLSPASLTGRLRNALELGGYDVAIATAANDRPLLLEVTDAEARLELRVFLWNITHGGKSRAADEFRVQTTRPAAVPFLVGANTPRTLLLGYHESDVFAAWDVRLHPNPSKSSSLQVSLGTLSEARQAGFASLYRSISGDQEEIVMAFAPTQVRDYLELLPSYLEAVQGATDVRVLGAPIALGEAPDEDDLPADTHRRLAIRQVVTVVRNARFRKLVIDAYDGKCAFCGLGLSLLDAAHIQAVHEGGPDFVPNGLAACPNHHRAFDRGLILIDPDGSLTVNVAQIEVLGLDEADIDQFEEELQPNLTKPKLLADAPAEKFLAHHRAKWLLEDD